MKLLSRRTVEQYVRSAAGAPWTGSGPRVVVVDGDQAPTVGETKTVRNTTVKIVTVGKNWIRQQLLAELESY